MASLGKRISFSIFTLVVVFGGAELGLRAAGWPQPDGAFAHNEPFWVTDAGLQDKVFPHREEATTFLVSTDRNGLRAPLHDVDRPARAQRIMAMGCSTTFGWGVDDAASYPARLEARLTEAGHDVEVINAGQPGYTSFQGAWLWDTLARHYEPDVVFVGYVVQDARKAAYSDKSQAILQQDARFLKHNLLYNLRLYLGLRTLLGQVQVRAKERGAQDEGGVFRVPPEEYAYNLRQLVRMIRETHAEPVLFGFPLEREGYTETHRRILRAAEKLGVRHIDLQARMEAATHERQLYFTHDRGHPNADGNDLIATWLMDWLLEQGVVGS